MRYRRTRWDEVNTRTALTSLILPYLCLFANAQGMPQRAVIITAPSKGAIVHPGEVIDVVVTSDNASSLKYVGVTGNRPFASGSSSSGPPFHIGLTIPSKYIGAGPYKLSALGQTASGAPVDSEIVIVDVERTDKPTKLIVWPPKLMLQFPGDQVHLKVTGVFTDGSSIDMTRSSEVVYHSENGSIVAVDTQGQVTGLSSGRSTIFVECGTITAQIPVNLPSLTTGDLNGDGVIDQDDLNILLGAQNTLAVSANDARDLNHDGKIDALDARILVTLFTNPRGQQ
jgi:hypothetical protein